MAAEGNQTETMTDSGCSRIIQYDPFTQRGGRIMDLHDSSEKTEEEDTKNRDLILRYLGLRLIGGEIPPAGNVTDVSWKYPMGSGLYNGIERVVIKDNMYEYPEGGVVVNLLGSRHFADVEMTLDRRLKMVFFVEEGEVTVKPLSTTGESMMKVYYRSVAHVKKPSEDENDSDGNQLYCFQDEHLKDQVGWADAVMSPDVKEPVELKWSPNQYSRLESEEFLEPKGLSYFEEIEPFADWFFFGEEEVHPMFRDFLTDEERFTLCEEYFGMEKQDMKELRQYVINSRGPE